MTALVRNGCWVALLALVVSALPACGGGGDETDTPSGGSSGADGSAGINTGGATAGTPGSGGTGGSGTTAGNGGSVTGGSGTTAGSGGSVTGGSGGTTAGGGGSAGSPVDCTNAACQFASGLALGCARRFALGVNYAWHYFGGDFGGIAQWSQEGVVESASAVSADLARLSSNGAAVVRWWMFPDFRGDGVTFDANGDPTGISAGARTDIARALELAAQHDLHVVFTLFSFDGFRPTTVNDGVTVRSIGPIVSNATRRGRLVDNVVRPVARAVAASPHAQRMLGWDVINEPEWAIAPNGAAPQFRNFTPTAGLTTVDLATMKAFLNQSLAALKAETPSALRSVGWASVKWSWAFTDVTDLEFNQPHIYAWANEDWPYTQAPNALGYPNKPTVYGEFALASMPFGTGQGAFGQVLDSWYDNGFAGAWAWAFRNAGAQLPLISSFATEKGCSARF